jgi:hypothetical protein
MKYLFHFLFTGALKKQVLHDDRALFTGMSYIDLNQILTSMVACLEEPGFTPIQERI